MSFSGRPKNVDRFRPAEIGDKLSDPQWSDAQKAANTALSRVRIFIEHAIGGMKLYNILVHTF